MMLTLLLSYIIQLIDLRKALKKKLKSLTYMSGRYELPKSHCQNF